MLYIVVERSLKGWTGVRLGLWGCQGVRAAAKGDAPCKQVRDEDF